MFDEEISPKQLGQLLRFIQPLDVKTIKYLADNNPEFAEELKKFLKSLRKEISLITERVKDYVDFVYAFSNKKSIRVSVRAVCCYAKRCGTCLGRYRLHYPYIYVYDERSEKWRHVKNEDLVDFLRFLEFNEEMINDFLNLIRARHQMISIYHNLIRIFNAFGLLEVTV